MNDAIYPLTMAIFLSFVGISGFLADPSYTAFGVAPTSTPSAPVAQCQDTDGNNIWIKGVTISQGRRVEDRCQTATTLVEIICQQNTVREQIIPCSNGCRNGACQRPAVSASPQAPRQVYGEVKQEQEEPRTAKLAATSFPTATVDTSSGTTVVSTAQPTFRVAEKPQEQPPRRSREAERRVCLQNCVNSFGRCLENNCEEVDPFEKITCVMDCERVSNTCRRRC